jgi:hypothetical protein
VRIVYAAPLFARRGSVTAVPGEVAPGAASLPNLEPEALDLSVLLGDLLA